MVFSHEQQKHLKNFFDQCNWAYGSWLMKKHLFNENPQDQLMKSAYHRHFFDRLDQTLQEYWLLQVAKLFDPKNKNLSLDYIISLTPSNNLRLKELKAEMEDLIKGPAQQARHKLLAHNDRATHFEGITLGSFAEGNDEKFFLKLKEFVEALSRRTPEGLYVFDDLVKNDVEIFVHQFNQGEKIKRLANTQIEEKKPNV